MEKMSSDNIKVVVRARPLKKGNIQFVPWVIDDKKIYQTDEDNTPIGDTYSYDEVFNVDTKNVDIYETAISSLVRSAIDGINLTIFAYGATSSGKTYTMNGIPEDPGIIPRFIEDIFNQVESYCHRKFLIRVSYVEIYSEIINDLLDKNNKDLKVREDINNCVSYNPKELIVKSSCECMNVMRLGTGNRTVGETNMNLFSSRSHSIFRIVIESAPTTNDENDPVQVSHVNLIDLAGSERVSQTGATGQRFKEGAHINKSLTALGLVIKQLVEKNDYVNYRDSKLTRILSNSLGGNAKTLIICNINLESLEDTASTLMFAQRAKAVKNKPKVNEIMNEAALTKKYAKECSEVKKLLDVEFEKNKQLENERERSSKKIQELLSRIKSLQEIFVKKETLPRPPKRRHTFCSLDAITEEREMESASKNLLSIGLKTGTDDLKFSPFKVSDSPAGISSYSKVMESQKSVDITPPKNLKTRLEILTREYEELIAYTRSEGSERQAMASKYEQLLGECQDLKLLLEVKDKQLKSEQTNAEQIKIDYEFMLENQKKKFQRRELELLEQISRTSTKPDVDAPVAIENLPLRNSSTVNTFEYEEMSEKISCFKQQNEELQYSTQTLKLENDELNGLIADLRNSVNTIELQNSQLKIKNKSLQTKVLDMEVKLNNGQQDADTSKNDIDSLKKKIKELEGNNNELKTELGKLRDELYESQDKLIEVTEDLDIEEKKKASLQEQLDEKQQELVKEKEFSQEIKQKLAEEVELRQDIMQQLCTLKNILEPKSQQNDSSLKAPNTPKESVYNSPEDTRMNESYMDASDVEKSLNYTGESLYESIHEIDQENIENFSSSYFQDRSKSDNFMNFFNSFIKGDNDVSKSSMTKDEEKDTKSEQNMSEIEKLQKDLNTVKLQRESDIKTIQKLQAQLEEYSNMNLSDSQKINKTNKILATLELMEAEKAENLSLIHKLKEQHQNDKVNYQELENNLKATNDELKEKNTEIQMLLANMEKLNEEMTSQTDKSDKKNIEIYDIQQDQIYEKIISEEEINELLAEKNIFRRQIEEQKQEINRYVQYLKDKDKALQNLAEENSIIREKLEAESLKLEQEKEANSNCSKQLELLATKVEDMNILIQEKEAIIQRVNECKMDMDIGEKDKTNSEQLLKPQSTVLQINHNDLNDEEKNLQISFNKIEITDEQQEKTKVEELSNEIKDLKNELKTLSYSVKEKEEIIDCIKSEKIRIEEERDELSEKIKELTIQMQTHITHINEQDELRLRIEQILKENEEIRKDQEKLDLTLKEEREKNANYSNDIGKLETKSKELLVLLEEKESIIAENNTQISELREEINNLSMKMSDLLVQIEQQKESVTKSNEDRDNVTDLLNNIKELQSEVENMSSAICEKDKIMTSINLEKSCLENEKITLSEKVNELMMEIQTQKENLDELIENLKGKEILSQKLTEENEMLKKEQEATNSRLKEQENKITDLANNIQNLQSESDKLLATIKEKELIISEINTERTNWYEEKNNLSTRIGELMEQLEQKEATETKLNQDREKVIDLLNNIKELQSKLENMSSAIREKDEIINNINLQKNDIEIEKNNYSEKVNDLMIQIQTQKDSFEELNENLKNKDMNLQEISEQNEMLKKEQEATNSRLKEQEIKIIDLMNTNENLQIESDKLLANIKEKELIILKISTGRTNLHRENSNLSMKMNELMVQIDEQKETKTILNQEREQSTDLWNEIEKLQKDVENLSSIICEKDEIIKNINLLRNDLESEKSFMSEKINDLMIQVQSQKHSFEEINDTLKSKEQYLHNVLEEKEVLKKKQEYTDTRLKELENKITDFANNNDKLKIESEKQLETIKEKERIILEIDTEKNNLYKEKSNLSKKISELMTQIEQQKGTEIILNQERETVADLLKNKKKLQTEIDDLSVAIREKDKIIARITSEKTELEKEKREISDQMKDSIIQVQMKTRELEELKHIIKNKEKHAQQVTEENHKLKNKLEHMHSNLGEQIQEKMDLLKDIVKRKGETEKLQLALKEKELIISELNSLKARMEEEINKLTTKINEMQIEHQTRNETISDQEKQNLLKTNSDLLNNLFSLTSINAELENKMRDLRTEFSERLGAHITKMKSLFGIEEEKNWKYWEQQKKLETKWGELKKIENLVSTLMKEKNSYIDSKPKLENAEKINKLKSELESQKEQIKFLQMAVDKVKQERETLKSEYEKKLQSVNTKLKTVYAEHEKEKKRVENLEYELRSMSKKHKVVGSSNHSFERDVSEVKNSEDKWKQQRTRAHDSRRSIDLDTLCSESTVDSCKYCEHMNKLAQKQKSEISQLRDEIETLNNKYEKLKRLCRLRNEEIQKLKEK